MLTEIGFIFLIAFVLFVVFCVLRFFSTNQRIRRYVRHNCNTTELWWKIMKGYVFKCIAITFTEKDGRLQTLSLHNFMSLRKVRKQIGYQVADEWIVEIHYSGCIITSDYNITYLLHSPMGWQITDYENHCATLQDKVGEQLNISFGGISMPCSGINGEILRIVRDYPSVGSNSYMFVVGMGAVTKALVESKPISQAHAFKAIREATQYPAEMFNTSHLPVIDIKKPPK